LGTSFPVAFEIEFVQKGRAAITIFASTLGTDEVAVDRVALAQTTVDEL
jgi:hypothetical protein